MNYLPDPERLHLWDTWVYPGEDGRVHLFYLANRPGGAWGYVGHAVSRDWLHWEDWPEITLRGPSGAWDEGRCGTGMVFRYDDGRYYMTYTGALSQEEATGLLVSDDLRTWEKVTPDRPVWPRVRQRPYEEDGSRSARSPAWRDAYVTRSPGGEWEAVCSARVDQGPPAGRGCFARCRLHSLERWETLPPLCHVGEYASMEVPEIFAFEERFWAIFSTGSRWGVGLDTPERRAATGTFYLVAERWEGPYRRPADNLLLGAGEGRMDAYVARTVPWGGERLVYHHFAGALPAAGLPKVLRAEEERLFLAPWSGVQALWTAEADPGPWGSFPFGPAVPGTWEAGERSVRGECAWGADALLADAGAPDIDLEAEVTLLRGRRAGLAVGLRMDAESPGTAVLLDAERGEITVGGLERWPHACGPVLDGILDRVSRPVERGRAYRLRLLRRGRYLEFFVDGRLVFSTVLPDRPAGGALACVVESGSAEFRFSRLHAVEPLARG